MGEAFDVGVQQPAECRVVAPRGSGRPATGPRKDRMACPGQRRARPPRRLPPRSGRDAQVESARSGSAGGAGDGVRCGSRVRLAGPSPDIDAPKPSSVTERVIRATGSGPSTRPYDGAYGAARDPGKHGRKQVDQSSPTQSADSRGQQGCPTRQVGTEESHERPEYNADKGPGDCLNPKDPFHTVDVPKAPDGFQRFHSKIKLAVANITERVR